MRPYVLPVHHDQVAADANRMILELGQQMGFFEEEPKEIVLHERAGIASAGKTDTVFSSGGAAVPAR